MSRDQRFNDNWALLWGQQEALIHQKGLLVVFCMVPNYLGANSRHYSFMFKGMEELQRNFNKYNIDFRVFYQSAEIILPKFLKTIDAHLLVSDFDPLRTKQQWKERLIASLNVPLHQEDTHNIIPAWIISDKKEYAAYTLRPKIQRVLDDYLVGLEKTPFSFCQSREPCTFLLPIGTTAKSQEQSGKKKKQPSP